LRSTARLRILPFANSEKRALSFVYCAKGPGPCRDNEKTDGFACLDDGQTTGQALTKYELIINTKQKGLGLAIPPTLLARLIE
jgi:hypothetical protein